MLRGLPTLRISAVRRPTLPKRPTADRPLAAACRTNRTSLAAFGLPLFRAGNRPVAQPREALLSPGRKEGVTCKTSSSLPGPRTFGSGCAALGRFCFLVSFFPARRSTMAGRPPRTWARTQARTQRCAPTRVSTQVPTSGWAAPCCFRASRPSLFSFPSSSRQRPSANEFTTTHDHLTGGHFLMPALLPCRSAQC